MIDPSLCTPPEKVEITIEESMGLPLFDPSCTPGEFIRGGEKCPVCTYGEEHDGSICHEPGVRGASPVILRQKEFQKV